MYARRIIDHLSPEDPQGLAAAFSSRRGGCSPAPYHSLNLSYGVGDAPANVRANRQSLKERVGVDCLLSARQIHGAAVFSLTAPVLTDDLEVAGYDALLTNQPGIGLLVQQADCQAVMLFEPEQRLIANIHSGWRGSVANIIGKTIAQLVEFGARPERLRAAISPSLGPCCAEFVNYQRELPAAFHAFQVRPHYFDFWAISARQLAAAGVLPAHILNLKICTACDRDYFSYRRDKLTGRSASIIALR